MPRRVFDPTDCYPCDGTGKWELHGMSHSCEACLGTGKCLTKRRAALRRETGINLLSLGWFGGHG